MSSLGVVLTLKDVKTIEMDKEGFVSIDSYLEWFKDKTSLVRDYIMDKEENSERIKEVKNFSLEDGPYKSSYVVTERYVICLQNKVLNLSNEVNRLKAENDKLKKALWGY